MWDSTRPQAGATHRFTPDEVQRGATEDGVKREFPRLRRGNSVGSTGTVVSANDRGAPEMGTPLSLAEGVGFEPTRRFRQTVFKTASL